MTGRLFFKVFLWFWLSIIVVSVTLVGLTVLRHSRASEDEHWRDKYGPRVDMAAHQEAEVFDYEGASALARYVRSFESDPGVRNYVFDEDGKEVLARQAPPLVAQTLASVSQVPDAAANFFTKDRVIAENMHGPSGRAYSVIVTFPQPSFLRRRLFQFVGDDDLGNDGVIRLLAILGIAGLICFWLARQITTPIEKLRFATDEITNGQLKTRVDESVTSRGDELGELGRDFDRMAERIDALVSSHRRLLADVSHTLRSPLARLNVALGLARQRANLETSEQLDRIELEADRLNRLIGQLLTLARIDSAVDRERRSVFDLGVLLQEVAADGDYEARSRGRAVVCTVHRECWIDGVPEMLRGAIENVVRNAIRYTPEGTTVEIRMDARTVHGQPRAIIEVRDHGAGVSEDELTDLFLPFHRADNGRDRNPGGTGLGLAITKHAFTFHGGAATASNAPGGGLAVILELPTFSDLSVLGSKAPVADEEAHAAPVSMPS